MTDVSGPVTAHDASRTFVTVRSATDLLRTLVVAAGLCWSVLFVLVGLRHELQLYGDGSIFAYSVAVQDAWAFHWHNITGRLFVYVFSYIPAELYVGLTGDAGGGIVVYGLLFFAAPLLGLSATYLADRSQGRILFSFACLSTACLCPLVFGFPTEMWMAHAVFWPALAVCHYARGGIAGAALVFAMLLALIFTHGGALIFTVAILATLLLRGARDAAFRRAAAAVLVCLLVWLIVKLAYPPDEYIGQILRKAALHVFDLDIFTGDLMLLLSGALAAYGIVFLFLRRLVPAKAYIYAGLIVAVALAVYWLRLDQALHADNRYYLRTVIMLATPGFGALAAAYALRADGQLNLPIPFLPRIMEALAGEMSTYGAIGAVLLVMLVHAVETSKFVSAWTDYRSAVRALAMGAASDPALGDPRFVSSQRIGANLNRLSWCSTTHFLSVLLAPRFAPTRLVVDPEAGYFWLSCQTATANQVAGRSVPVDSRRLIRVYSCLHR
jgi:hypothetical protein